MPEPTNSVQEPSTGAKITYGLVVVLMLVAILYLLEVSADLNKIVDDNVIVLFKKKEVPPGQSPPGLTGTTPGKV